MEKKRNNNHELPPLLARAGLTPQEMHVACSAFGLPVPPEVELALGPNYKEHDAIRRRHFLFVQHKLLRLLENAVA